MTGRPPTLPDATGTFRQARIISDGTLEYQSKGFYNKNIDISLQRDHLANAIRGMNELQIQTELSVSVDSLQQALQWEFNQVADRVRRPLLCIPKAGKYDLFVNSEDVYEDELKSLCSLKDLYDGRKYHEFFENMREATYVIWAVRLGGTDSEDHDEARSWVTIVLQLEHKPTPVSDMDREVIRVAVIDPLDNDINRLDVSAASRRAEVVIRRLPNIFSHGGISMNLRYTEIGFPLVRLPWQTGYVSYAITQELCRRLRTMIAFGSIRDDANVESFWDDYEEEYNFPFYRTSMLGACANMAMRTSGYETRIAIEVPGNNSRHRALGLGHTVLEDQYEYTEDSEMAGASEGSEVSEDEDGDANNATNARKRPREYDEELQNVLDDYEFRESKRLKSDDGEADISPKSSTICVIPAGIIAKETTEAVQTDKQKLRAARSQTKIRLIRVKPQAQDVGTPVQCGNIEESTLRVQTDRQPSPAAWTPTKFRKILPKEPGQDEHGQYTVKTSRETPPLPLTEPATRTQISCLKKAPRRGILQVIEPVPDPNPRETAAAVGRWVKLLETPTSSDNGKEEDDENDEEMGGLGLIAQDELSEYTGQAGDIPSFWPPVSDGAYTYEPLPPLPPLNEDTEAHEDTEAKVGRETKEDVETKEDMETNKGTETNEDTKANGP